MSKVDININGRQYSVVCDEGQEPRVRDLAAIVDTRVRQLAGPGPAGIVGETHLLVLAGIMLADELSEAKSSPPTPAADSAEDDELLTAAVDHLKDRIDSIAAQLERA